VLVKICGITRAEDAVAAVACGATALGFVFWPHSPRAVDPYRAREIARLVPPFVTLVGVFVNQPAALVNAVASLVGLGVVQLHGDETPSVARAVRRPVLKAVTLHAGLAEAEAWPANVMLLVDADDPVRRGGTGETADWEAAASLARTRPVMLAGGLTPDNIVNAVSRVRPFGVDVSSGIERSPGVKDHHRLAALFERLRTVKEMRA
jgi:phosphoribosylanthranilate isomerase